MKKTYRIIGTFQRHTEVIDEADTLRTVTEAAADINSWLQSDSGFSIDTRLLEAAIQRDIHVEQQLHPELTCAPPSSRDCELLVTGDDEGEVPESLCSRWHFTNNLIADQF